MQERSAVIAILAHLGLPVRADLEGHLSIRLADRVRRHVVRCVELTPATYRALRRGGMQRWRGGRRASVSRKIQRERAVIRAESRCR